MANNEDKGPKRFNAVHGLAGAIALGLGVFILFGGLAGEIDAWDKIAGPRQGIVTGLVMLVGFFYCARRSPEGPT